MRLPEIKIKDKSNGKIRTVGESVHDALIIDMLDGTIYYLNLQNSGSTRFDDAEYEFVPCEELKEWDNVVEFIETPEIVDQKVIVKTADDKGVEYEFAHYICPGCKNVLHQHHRKSKEPMRYKQNYCVDCGQKLEWPEVEHD